MPQQKATMPNGEAELLMPSLPDNILDLDAIAPRKAVRINGMLYQMPAKHGLSMNAREELRLIMLQISDIQNAKPGKDGKRTKVQQQVIDECDFRLCQLALPTCPIEILRELDPAARNALVNTFFTEVDVAETLQAFASTVKAQNKLNMEALAKKQAASGPPLMPRDALAPLPSRPTSANVRSMRRSQQGSSITTQD